MTLAVNIGHEKLMTRIIVRFEDDSTAHNIGIALHQSATEIQHAVRLVKMCHHLPIDVACRLFHAQQDVIDVLHRCIQRLLGIMHGSFS